MPVKTDVIKKLASDMEWTEAMGNVNLCVQIYASRIAAEGNHTREAVDRAQRILASWERIQRG